MVESKGPLVAERIARIDRGEAAVSLNADAARYAALALDMGASAALVTAASAVIVDDRVTFKCVVPKCFGYGVCANCPPYSPPPEQIRRLISQYQTAVVYRIDVPAAVIVRDRQTIRERAEAYKKSFTLAGALESAAFYDGHYLSVAFASGSCKSTYCFDVDCAVLAKQKCRHNLVARPSMEAVGIDCFALGERLGWEMYPIGSSASADMVPAAALMGIVFVG
jgi:predicted metal-binding protein